MIEAQLERANQLMQWQRYADAEKELRLILSQEPNSTRALAMLALCLGEQGKNQDALTTLRSAIGQEPDNDYLLYLQAYFFFREDKHKEAEQAVRNAIAFNPHEADYFGLLAAIRLAEKDWKQAVDFANQGLAIDAGNLQCLNTRSTALYKLDQKDEAYATIQEALNQDPENEYTHANLGWSLLEKGDHKKALEHFREALKINPDYAYAKAGLVQGLKARYWFYRMFLKYAFWISNFSQGGQIAILLGLYFGVKVLNQVAEKNPELGVFIYPIIYLYTAFALSSWVITPLSNLFLRLNVYGRYALTREEIRASNLVGLSFGVGLLGFLSLLVSPTLPFVMLGIFGMTMMIPLGSFARPKKNWRQTVLVIYTAGLALLGVGAIYGAWLTGEVTNLAVYYVYGMVGFQWIANFFLIRD